MKRLLMFGVVSVGLIWSCLFTWLAGYQSGYEEGSGTAWQKARTAFVAKNHQVKMAYDVGSNANKFTR